MPIDPTQQPVSLIDVLRQTLAQGSPASVAQVPINNSAQIPGGGMTEGDRRFTAATNIAQQRLGRTLSAGEKQNIMAEIHGNKNWSDDELAGLVTPSQ